MTQIDRPNNGILWLKLSLESKQLLQKLYPPKYASGYYDHVTLAYDVRRESVEQFVGNSAKTTAYAYAYNAWAEAVRVSTAGLPDTYGVPHITLSTLPGIEPFAAVAMLKSEHAEAPIDPPFELEGHIEFISL